VPSGIGAPSLRLRTRATLQMPAARCLPFGCPNVVYGNLETQQSVALSCWTTLILGARCLKALTGIFGDRRGLAQHDRPPSHSSHGHARVSATDSSDGLSENDGFVPNGECR
jgi:hypothetical protein